MKKIISFSTILFAIFIFITCNVDNFDGESRKLETPEELKINGNVLNWDQVDNASKYKVKVGSQVQTIDSQNFSLNDIEDGTKLSIQAIDDNGEYTNSSWSKEIIYTSLSSNSEDDLALSAKRIIAKSFPNDKDEYVGYSVVNNRSLFYFYLGSILDTPVSYSKSIRLTNNNIEYTFQDETTFEEDFSDSQTIAKSITKTREFDVGLGFEYTKSSEIGIPQIGDFKTEINAEFTANMGFGCEEEITTSNTAAHNYGTSNSKINSLKYTLSTENNIGDSNFFEYNYFYRLAEYSTMDAYGVISIDPETNEYTWDFHYYARMDKNSISLEKSSDTNGSFNPTSNEELVFDLEKAFEAINREKEKIPTDVNSQLVSTEFSAYLWCEQSNLGKVNFNVVGVKVQYDGRYYVYGTATFAGTLWGNRFNDVDQIALKSSNRKIATGGLLQWKGTKDDVNEWGDASWTMGSGFGNNYAYYSPSGPTQDFPADENIQISITNICVELGVIGFDKSVPEMISSTFSADVYTEGTRNCNVQFIVFGMKVKYDNAYYIMGNAFFSGNGYGTRFNDAGIITLVTNGAKILSGGNLHWAGSNKGDENTCGIAGYVQESSDKTRAKYISENCEDDFPGNESFLISITGICVQLNENNLGRDIVPEILKIYKNLNIFSEHHFQGNAIFQLIGIKVKQNGKEFIFGNAFFSGNIGGSRFNDVEYYSISFADNDDANKTIKFGGTLNWYGSYDDNNESGIGSWDNVFSGNRIYYLTAYPENDFAGNEDFKISITGICMEV